MAQTAEAVSNVTNLQQQAIGEAVIEGKITDISQPSNGDYTYYTISGKAADAYSLPPVMQVSQSASQRPFARVDDQVKIRVRLAGYPRRGQGSTRYITNTLTFIEHA